MRRCLTRGVPLTLVAILLFFLPSISWETRTALFAFVAIAVSIEIAHGTTRATAAYGARAWYLLVAVVTGLMGLLVTGLVMVKLPGYLPLPRTVASTRDAFLLRLPLGLAACPACTPMLFPIATASAASGGPLYGASLLFLFGLGRGIPILVAAFSLEGLRRMRRLIPMGLAAQQVAGWLLLGLSGLYLLQALLVLSGHAALFV